MNKLGRVDIWHFFSGNDSELFKESSLEFDEMSTLPRYLFFDFGIFQVKRPELVEGCDET